MADRIRAMKEGRSSSVALRRGRAAARFAAALALALLAGCGQKGPLFLPAQGGHAATRAAGAPSAPQASASAASASR
jgi:predicted small lipoprotein YifL